MITDPFTYSNGALASQTAWNKTSFDGGLTVASNAVIGTNNSSRCNLRTDAWGATQSSKVTLTTANSNIFPGVIVHGSDTGTGLNGYLFGGEYIGSWYLQKYTAGEEEELASTPHAALSAPVDIEILIDGNDVVAKVDGSEVLRASNETTYRSGVPGRVHLPGSRRRRRNRQLGWHRRIGRWQPRSETDADAALDT